MTDHYVAPQSGRSFDVSLLVGMQLRPGLALGVGGLYTLFTASDAEPTKNGVPWPRDLAEARSVHT